MTPRQTIEKAQSERRERIAALLSKDDRTDDETTELGTLTNELQTGEVELRAAISVEEPANETVEPTGTDDGESKEIREIRSRVVLGEYVAAAVEMRGIAGAEAEYNAAMGVTTGLGKFPLSLLAPQREVRTTSTTDANGQVTQSNWLDRLFSETMASYLGITFESVAAGKANYPVVTAGASAAQRSRDQAAANAAWTVGSTDMDPSRNSVRVEFNNVDALRLPGLEDALRRDMGMALTEGVDRSVFVGDDGATDAGDDVTGLQTASNVVEETLTQTNKVKPAETLAAFLAFIDGKHASMVEDLNVVLSVGAHNLWAGTIANSAAENETLLAFLKANGLSCRTRGDIDDATTNGKFGAFVGRRRGIAGAAVAAVWNEAELIRDPYTNAAKGDVALTLSHYWAFALPRATNFGRVKFVT